jgi:hypothetical protein
LKKTNNKLNNKYADFVIQFVFAKNIIIFELPCFELKEYKPSPSRIIQLHYLGQNINANVGILRDKISSNDQRVDGGKSISFETTETSSLGKMDLKDNKDIDHIKNEVKKNSDLENVKRYIIEINNYFNICIPFSIYLDGANKFHIENLFLCSKNGGKFKYDDVRLKVPMDKSIENLIKNIETNNPSSIKIKNTKVFDFGTDKFNYYINYNLINPSCRPRTNKKGVKSVTFRGNPIKVELGIKYKYFSLPTYIFSYYHFQYQVMKNQQSLLN